MTQKRTDIRVISHLAGRRHARGLIRMAESGALPLRNDNDDPAVLTLFSGKDQAGVGELLDHPSSWAIDLDCGDPGKGLTRMPARLLLRLSTVSVLRHDAVGLMVEALCSRLPRLISIRDDIHLALQEAVGNAVIHGNLGLDGRLRATREGLLAFTQVMHRRSDDPRFGHRPVTIAADWNQHHLVIRVEDRGRGFKPSRIPVPIKPTAPSGRGLCHIRALCRRVSFTAHGRRISMRFALP